MKKVLLLLLMAAFSMAANAQVKKDSLTIFSQKPSDQTVKNKAVAVPVDTLNFNIEKYRFLKIGEQVHDVQAEIPLFVSMQYILSSYSFFDEAKSGLSKKEVEQLQQPLLPYWNYYLQQQKQQAQKK